MNTKWKTVVFLDFEFTWLDYYENEDNEIISMSYIIGDEKPVFKIYNSKKENVIWSYLINKITREDQDWKPYFSKEEFLKEMKCNSIEEVLEKYVFIWYWIYTDFKKCFQELFDLDFSQIDYIDLKEELEVNELYDLQMIKHWNSFEVACYLLFKEIPEWHTETHEVELQKRMFEHLNQPEIIKHRYDNWIHKYVPFWIFKWKDINAYIYENRRNADWIRFNNIHQFANSLDFLINSMGYDDEYNLY